jgi:hypothetical protein
MITPVSKGRALGPAYLEAQSRRILRIAAQGNAKQ